MPPGKRPSPLRSPSGEREPRARRPRPVRAAAAEVAAPPVWDEIRAAFVAGEELPEIESASGQRLRRWPSLHELSSRFGVDFPALSARASIDGWEARRGVFQAEIETSRQRLIAERIASQDMPSRMAYLGIHNDIIRGLGRLIQQGVTETGCTFLPRDLKVIADTTLSCAEIMGTAQGRLRGSESAVSLAVRISQSQAHNVPPPVVGGGFGGSLPNGEPATIEAVPQPTSLWQVLIQARRGPSPVSDPFDHPSPLPSHLASDR